MASNGSAGARRRASSLPVSCTKRTRCPYGQRADCQKTSLKADVTEQRGKCEGAQGPLRVQSTRIFKLFQKFENTHSVAKRLFRHAEAACMAARNRVRCVPAPVVPVAGHGRAMRAPTGGAFGGGASDIELRHGRPYRPPLRVRKPGCGQWGCGWRRYPAGRCGHRPLRSGFWPRRYGQRKNKYLYWQIFP